MQMMGQGLAEAGANIGRSNQQAWNAVAQGISKVGDVYSQYKSAKASNDITKSLINDPQYASIMGLPDPRENPDQYEEQKTKILQDLDQTIKSHGQIGGAQFSKQYLGPLQEYAQIGRQYKQQMEMERLRAEAARQQPYYNAGAQGLLQSATSEYGAPQKSLRYSGGVMQNTFNDPRTIQISPIRYQ